MRTGALSIVCLSLAAFSIACGGGGSSSGGGGTPPPPPTAQLAISTASILPPTVQGHAYSTTLAAVNGQGALHWTIAPLSSTALFVTGLAIDAASGVLSGTANFAGTGGFIATVSDSASPARTATRNFTVTAFQPLTSAQSQSATVNEFQNFLNVRTGIQGGVPPISYSVSSGSCHPA
jgi:hypothetical protein